jgi:hypothetical protein
MKLWITFRMKLWNEEFWEWKFDMKNLLMKSCIWLHIGINRITNIVVCCHGVRLEAESYFCNFRTLNWFKHFWTFIFAIMWLSIPLARDCIGCQPGLWTVIQNYWQHINLDILLGREQLSANNTLNQNTKPKHSLDMCWDL